MPTIKRGGRRTPKKGVAMPKLSERGYKETSKMITKMKSTPKKRTRSRR